MGRVGVYIDGPKEDEGGILGPEAVLGEMGGGEGFESVEGGGGDEGGGGEGGQACGCDLGRGRKIQVTINLQTLAINLEI